MTYRATEKGLENRTSCRILSLNQKLIGEKHKQAQSEASLCTQSKLYFHLMHLLQVNEEENAAEGEMKEKNERKKKKKNLLEQCIYCSFSYDLTQPQAMHVYVNN
ncbi:hypothetical protein TorRG33x02_126020 [Trema orientale]|uniref:Uncharacterized protein n=1 Tax=Trema orientale TaxID=63057 RepID=A0A2P5F1A3_TREOI|nr:hypothetical protein TorRG33x02_126020 [Trema orientale]